MWLTAISFPEDKHEQVKKLVEAIKAKDPSFIYMLGSTWVELKSPDRNVAHKRGTLLVKKYLKELDLNYQVLKA